MVLPRCLRGEALKWLIELDQEIVEDMNSDLYVWETELLKQFKKSRQQAMQKALIALLREAGITDQIQLVQHLYDGLKAQLQVTCLIDEFAHDFPSVNDFQQKIKSQETASFKL
ncbi:hypothetical protein AJ78_04754 [Emergomyces pasteurianus Ep9510]|uniref:Uncharacterized protein n=1 Tax=Emergomyces pasteurianus Ep9510 TaxID=1447872 RepID=A0A1J9Q419_9EURO|nr:hypothetical protein AJ78_04754 [Emergomyces pasteurianus Ep9510]